MSCLPLQRAVCGVIRFERIEKGRTRALMIAVSRSSGRENPCYEFVGRLKREMEKQCKLKLKS